MPDGKAKIAAPTVGTVLAVNGRLREHPDLIHRDPCGRGWLVRMQDGDGKLPESRGGEERACAERKLGKMWAHRPPGEASWRPPCT